MTDCLKDIRTNQAAASIPTMEVVCSTLFTKQHGVSVASSGGDMRERQHNPRNLVVVVVSAFSRLRWVLVSLTGLETFQRRLSKHFRPCMRLTHPGKGPQRTAPVVSTGTHPRCIGYMAGWNRHLEIKFYFIDLEHKCKYPTCDVSNPAYTACLGQYRR